MKGQMNVKTAPLKVQGNKNFDGATAAPHQPRVKEMDPRSKGVPMAPKINEGTGGKPDGAKRIINTEDKPAGRNAAIGKSTFRAPRNDSRGSATECGYTPLPMGNTKTTGNGNR